MRIGTAGIGSVGIETARVGTEVRADIATVSTPGYSQKKNDHDYYRNDDDSNYVDLSHSSSSVKKSWKVFSKALLNS